ncbi:MAG: hypothetical protein EPN21_20000 [Methylococcaceae bacterium]|nr:MAG: hypothetical protein EPN21_20000 [Methylococcaceae bacterium]
MRRYLFLLSILLSIACSDGAWASGDTPGDKGVGMEAPIITEVTPTTATLHQLTRFVVTGVNLTADMELIVKYCKPVGKGSTGSATRRVFQCTPQKIGDSKLTIKEKHAGKTLLTSKIIVFSSPNVVLLLHGMSSNPGVWEDLTINKTGYFKSGCPIIYAGALSSAGFIPNARGTYCFRVKFGEYDMANKLDGLDHAKQYAIHHAWPMSGDFSTFYQLGQEVEAAVDAILSINPNAKIVLLGHSRGGLAARAFLQTPGTTAAKSSIKGLITSGTPHQGSRLGRIYFYIENSLLTHAGIHITSGNKDNDWRTINFLLKGNKLDVRRPTVGFLADTSAPLKSLRRGIKYLPNWIRYGQIYYAGTDLGVLGSKFGIDYTIFGINWLNAITVSSPMHRALGLKFGLDDVFDIDIPDININLEKQLSNAARIAILGPGRTPRDYKGDGIVPENSQKGGAPHAHSWRGNGGDNVFHLEEPQQVLDIATMFCRMGFSDWLSRCPVGKTAPESLDPPYTADVAVEEEDTPALTAASTQRRQDYQAWQELPIEEQWRRWQAMNGEDDDVARELLGNALAERLQQGEDGGVYQEAGLILRQSATPLAERARLAALLGQTATQAALQTLLQVLEMGDAALRPALLSVIERVGDERWNGRFPAELSPLLQAAWQDAGNDAALLASVARALARIGTPDGVALLLQAVAQSGQSAAALERRAHLSETDARALAAWDVLSLIRNPDAIPVLSQGLHQRDAVLSQAAGDALAAMGYPEATAALLQWARLADDAVEPKVALWLNRLRDSDSKQLLRENLSSSRPYRSQRVRKALRDRLDKLDAP